MFENIKLPWWMSGEELTKLKNAAIEWFKRIAQWAKWPLEQIDPLTCDRGILELIAWQRDITRYDGEPLDLYRKRVAYAFVNARDAGSTIGFINICERLDIGHISTEERIQGIDWDIINIHLNDDQLADNPELLKTIIRQYGRTCRRYNFLLETPVLAYMRCGEVANSFATVVALLPPTRSVTQSQIHELGLNRKTLAAGLPILPPEPPEPDQAIGYGKGHEVVYSRLTASAGLPLKPPPFPEPVSMTAFAKGDELALSRKTVSAVLPIPESEPHLPFFIRLQLLTDEITINRLTVTASLTELYTKLKARNFSVASNNSTFVASLAV